MRQIIRDLVQSGVAGGILLLTATILALVFSNTSIQNIYHGFLQTKVAVHIGPFSIDKYLLLWVNDGLMVFFFLLVGLELKRELLVGELSSLSRVTLPAIAALGGIIVPALLYLYFNGLKSATTAGWAIPTATDIAFALSILAMVGRGVPLALKLFLLTLAILDDISGIAIIAIFHTQHMSWLSLGLAVGLILILFLLNRLNIQNNAVYGLFGTLLWACVLKSGVHATLAGVVLAFMVPLGKSTSEHTSPLLRLEHNLTPWVQYLIVPLFAFVNAGLTFKGVTAQTWMQPIVLGVLCGLFFGKQIGIMLFSWIAVKCKLAQLPHDIRWRDIYGVAVLCGIGFTMSLFIGTLAFSHSPQQMSQVQLGVLSASVLAGILGYFIIKWGAKKRLEREGVL